MEEGLNYQVYSFYINVLTLVVLVISVWLLRSQISKGHEWNRRIAAQDLTNQMIRGEVLDVRQRLDQYCNFYDPLHNYSVCVNDDNKNELDFLLKIFLSYFEGVALGIKHNIYDEDIVYEYLGSIIPEVYRWSEGYVRDFRNKAGDDTIFLELTDLAKKWQIKNEDLKKKVQKIVKTDGKKRL
jgi:hypothetical protein